MAYSDFSLDKVKKMFLLTEQRIALFETEKNIEPSEWLKETLSLGLETALSSSSEKARSEFIVENIPESLKIQLFRK